MAPQCCLFSSSWECMHIDLLSCAIKKLHHVKLGHTWSVDLCRRPVNLFGKSNDRLWAADTGGPRGCSCTGSCDGHSKIWQRDNYRHTHSITRHTSKEKALWEFVPMRHAPPPPLNRIWNLECQRLSNYPNYPKDSNAFGTPCKTQSSLQELQRLGICQICLENF